MISSKFFIINQGMELGDKTPIPPPVGSKAYACFSFLFLFYLFFLLVLVLLLFNLQRLVNGCFSLLLQGLSGT